MSLLAHGEPAESSETDSPAVEAEPDVLVDFTAMLQRQRQGGEYGGWFGCDSKMQTTQSDQGYYLEQYVLGVLDFSSQYGIDYSISYTAANVIGRPTKFPAYGDYPETFPMRTYGDWWQRAPSATREIQPQNLPKLETHDYVVVYFEEFVVPTEVAIFETFNPGAVVRIWAYGLTKNWTCLWEATESDLARPPPLDSRRFAPPLKKTTMLTKTLRIDFNHSRLNYYTEIDAIMLCGRTVTKTQNLLAKQQIRQHSRTLVSPPPEVIGSTPGDSGGGSISYKLRTLKFQPNCGEDGATKLHEFINNDLVQFLADNCVDGEEAAPQVCLTDLPFEILLRILSYLDLKSLFRVGHVSRTFYDISTHPLLYAEISLKPYWDVASSELLCTLARRATMLRKLDLSWCGGFGNVSPTEFKKFLTQRGDNLTHLRLNSCKFLNASCIENVGIVCDNLIELSLRNCATEPPLLNFSCLANLKNLERLDLFQTYFETELLLSMLEGNRKLKHLNLVNSRASYPATGLDQECLLILTDRQEGSLWRSSEVRVERWCKLRGNLLFYLKDKDPKSAVAGLLVLENCRARIQNEERDPDGYVFDLDFKDSPSERFITRSSAERLAWVQCIEQASSERLNALIRQLKDQIVSQSRQPSSGASSMGNHIDLGMPLEQQMQEQLQLHGQLAEDGQLSVSVTTEVVAPIEGDLIQF
ncbi:GD15856 [Drosophila simulans]|uniref:GD15856 n=2 Tax=Drosophila simulans TaxID=7240 RepID=B4R4N4_DROSI|nr:GD15856 [Drosophila simulans]